MLSCQSGNNDQAKNPSGSTDTSDNRSRQDSLNLVGLTSNALDELYLQNGVPGNTDPNSLQPQLHRLLRDRNPGTTEYCEKIVFQFYHRVNERMTLGGFPARRRNQRYRNYPSKILQNTRNEFMDITGKALFLVIYN